MANIGPSGGPIQGANMPYVPEPADPRMLADNMSDAGSSTSSGMLSDVRSRRTGSIDTTPSAGPRGSLRSRHTRASMHSKAPTNYEEVPNALSLFEWNCGGRNVYLTGSWDNYTEKIPMESIQPGNFRCTVKVPQERLEFKFIVDGVEKFNPDYPTIYTETGERVNVKHVDPDGKKNSAGTVRKIVSKISGLDMYSPFHMAETLSMIISESSTSSP
eukprot:IDg20816t1